MPRGGLTIFVQQQQNSSQISPFLGGNDKGVHAADALLSEVENVQKATKIKKVGALIWCTIGHFRVRKIC